MTDEIGLPTETYSEDNRLFTIKIKAYKDGVKYAINKNNSDSVNTMEILGVLEYVKNMTARNQIVKNTNSILENRIKELEDRL